MTVPGKTRGQRQYVRKFDHEEAQQRYEAGEGPTALAREYGVSISAIHRIVYQSVIEGEKRIREQKRLSGRCERCGGWKNGLTDYVGVTLCKSCASDDMATSVRPTELHCMTCKEWKPDEAFPHDSGARLRRRGRHRQCRPCLTKARQDYRERHKVPCVGCGKPALPPNEKRTGGIGVPRCLDCMTEHYRTPEFRAVARERSLRALRADAPTD